MGIRATRRLAIYGNPDDCFTTTGWEDLSQELSRRNVMMRMAGEAKNLFSWVRTEERWVSGSEFEGPRHGTLLVAPTASEVNRIQNRWPKSRIVIGESFSEDLRLTENSVVVPRLVPEVYFPTANLSDVFGVTAKYHLEARPRILYGGGYTHGPTLTKLLAVASRILSHGGELVLLDSLAIRSIWAPVIRRLGLSENVVFVGELSDREQASVVMGADSLWVLGPESRSRGLLSNTLATGTPIVAQHGEALEAVLGPAALWVYEDDVEIWVDAATKALVSEPVREELSRRAMARAVEWHERNPVQAWAQAMLNE